MAYLFVEYPKCTTCKRAKKWLDLEMKLCGKKLLETAKDFTFKRVLNIILTVVLK